MAKKTPNLSKRLTAIRALALTAQEAEAQAELEELVKSLPCDDLENSRAELVAVLDVFLPKRRTALESLLSKYFNPTQPRDAFPHGFQDELRAEFVRLSNTNIFDWDSSYKPFLAALFQRLKTYSVAALDAKQAFLQIREETRIHSREIFQKGFQYQTQRTEADKRLIALRGCKRFAELPIQVYLDNMRIIDSASVARIVRAACSAIFAGVICGFSESNFGEQTGEEILLASDFWQESLPYLTKRDFSFLEPRLQQYRSGHSIRTSILPLIDAIDRILLDQQASQSKTYCLPAQTHWEPKLQRIDVNFVHPAKLDDKWAIRLVCYLMKEFVALPDIQQHITRGMQIVVAPLTPALDMALGNDTDLRERVVNTASGSAKRTDAQAGQIFTLLLHEISTATGLSTQASPLRYNFADDFPLEKSEVTEQFYVDRPSIAGLIPSVNERTGVRLWTSLRRSGKTTGCIKLASQSGIADVVFQTCQFTDQSEYANILIDQVQAAIAAKARVANDFLNKIVVKCSGRPERVGLRFVLIVDEYESLFEDLDYAVRQDRSLQRLVAEPILNQILAFSRQNLVILLGQRPDAHFILMERNQLSPCIQHESFPLFTHLTEESGTEFRDLIAKALTYRIPFSREFANLIYAETHGHPFLTVNLLRDVLDWAIDSQCVMQGQELSEEHFVAYASVQLTSRHIRESRHFETFRKFLYDFLSPSSRETTPWLYAVHEILREISLRFPGALRCSLDDVKEIYQQRGLETLPIDHGSLLQGAARANFLKLDNDSVIPTIPLVARIAGAVRSGVL